MLCDMLLDEEQSCRVSRGKNEVGKLIERLE